MSEELTVPQAAQILGTSDAAVYYHAKKRPHLFKVGDGGTTITRENVELLRKRKKPEPKVTAKPRPAVAAVDANDASAPPSASRPGEKPTKPVKASMVKNVGFWCKKCGDLKETLRMVCRCLWYEQSEKAEEKHKASNWLPAHVDLPQVTMESANKR
jgi:hypothetical protein